MLDTLRVTWYWLPGARSFVAMAMQYDAWEQGGAEGEREVNGSVSVP